MRLVDACPNCGDREGNSRWGHEDPDVYDGVLYWSCAACGHVWPRDFDSPKLASASRKIVWQIHATRHRSDPFRT